MDNINNNDNNIGKITNNPIQNIAHDADITRTPIEESGQKNLENDVVIDSNEAVGNIDETTSTVSNNIESTNIVPNIKIPLEQKEIEKKIKEMINIFRENNMVEATLVIALMTGIKDSGEFDALFQETSSKMHQNLYASIGTMTKLVAEIATREADAEKVAAQGMYQSGILGAVGGGLQLVGSATSVFKSKSKASQQVDVKVKPTPAAKTPKPTKKPTVEPAAPKAKTKQKAQTLKEKKKAEKEAKLKDPKGKVQKVKRVFSKIFSNFGAFSTAIGVVTQSAGHIAQAKATLASAGIKYELADTKALQQAIHLSRETESTAMNKLSQMAQRAGDWQSSLLNTLGSYIQSVHGSTKTLLGGG